MHGGETTLRAGRTHVGGCPGTSFIAPPKESHPGSSFLLNRTTVFILARPIDTGVVTCSTRSEYQQLLCYCRRFCFFPRRLRWEQQ